MMIPRHAFSAVLPATGDDTRFALTCIQVQPNGQCVACDGSMLLTAKATDPANDADFPIEGLPTFNGNITAPVLVPADRVQRLIKATPAKSTIPILRSIQVSAGHNGTRATLAATDLQVPCIVTLATAEQAELNYPNWDRVIPKADRPEITVALAVPILEALLKSAKAIDAKAVKFWIAAEQGDTQPVTVRYNGYGKGRDEQVEVNGVVMPYTL